jgi:hypothetical protein
LVLAPVTPHRVRRGLITSARAHIGHRRGTNIGSRRRPLAAHVGLYGLRYGHIHCLAQTAPQTA